MRLSPDAIHFGPGAGGVGGCRRRLPAWRSMAVSRPAGDSRWLSTADMLASRRPSNAGSFVAANAATLLAAPCDVPETRISAFRLCCRTRARAGCYRIGVFLVFRGIWRAFQRVSPSGSKLFIGDSHPNTCAFVPRLPFHSRGF